MLLSVLFLTACQKQEIAPEAQAVAQTEKDAQTKVEPRCPLGHTTIKLVPITYGSIAMTPELREKEANLEIAFGGCDVGSCGENKIVCTTCGAHTFDDDSGWYDKTTKVIATGKGVKPVKKAEQSPGGSLKAAPQE